jgi:hypothetical protein
VQGILEQLSGGVEEVAQSAMASVSENPLVAAEAASHK